MSGVRSAEEELIAAIVESDDNGSRIPDAVAGIDLDLHRGAAAQLQVLDRHLASGDELAGWKVGMTSGESHNAMGDGVRPFGALRRSRLFHSGDTVSLARIPGAGIEVELGVVIGNAVGGPDVSREEIVEAIDGWVPCFELIQNRMGAVAAGSRIAANLSQWGVVAGTVGALDTVVSDLVVTIERDGVTVATAGPGYEIDDPIESLCALCARLSRFGVGLLPGQRVITGAFVKQPVAAPGHWRGTVSGVGDVEFTFK